MTVNYWAVLVCGVLAMVIGYIWYGPLFGKAWARAVGATAMDAEARKKMQKSAGPLYLVQFIMVLFQAWILARALGGSPDALANTGLIWFAFVVPTVAGLCMWNNDSRKVAWTKFLLSAGYQLILFVMFGLILGMWV